MDFEFLADREDERSWTVAGEEKGRYWVGDGQFALQVMLTTFPKEPSRKKVRDLWQERWNKQPSPVLLVAAWPSGAPERAMLCGPLGDDPSIVVRDVAQAERIARRALAEPSRAFAIQFITAALAEVDDALPGIRNEGLLSSHELRVGVPARKDWADASERATDMLGRSDRELVHAMGYTIDRKGEIAVLRTTAGGEARAVAVFLDRNERPDAPSVKFDHRTPVDMALLHARREGLRWVLAVRGSTLRLYSASTSGAAGQRGRTETFLELDLALLETQHAGYLTLLFAADALAAGGTFDEVASASRDFTTQLSERLRDQVYEHTVPRLAAAIAARHEGVPDKEALDGIYHAALTVLFRLLFLAYAEDRRLLPYDTSDAYRAASLKAIAHELTAAKNNGQPLGFDDPFAGSTTDEVGGSSDLWARCRTLFKAVEGGHKRWGIPPYGGGLFTKDSAEGKLLDDFELTDAEFGPALMALIVDRSPDGGFGPIDFRSLSVREFGSIYEGLLENELAVAEQDLTLKKDAKLKVEVFVPAGTDDDVTVAKGSVYLHNASGARKSSGSYFTPAFAVDHLIGTALTPTLEEHVAKVEALIDAGDEAGAAELLLDFRVTDISMGSGHFLTAAVDAIEAGITDLLARRPLPHFRKELERLRAAARSALGEAANSYEIEDSQLVRRLIARKCIYGVDLNPISVELARVSLWIHTFVPGLPLSFLDRTLIVGNSLTGIATVQEAVDALTSSGKQRNLFDDPIREALKAAEEPLRRLATISDATLDEVAEAKEATAATLDAVKPVRDVLDLIVANRLGEVSLPLELDVARLPRIETGIANDVAQRLQVVHFPIAFPEVFLRERGGFDVILGNPPWEKVKVEEHEFWGRHQPGLRGLPQREKNAAMDHLRETRPDLVADLAREQQQATELAAIVKAGPNDLGSGDTELARVFAWRFWDLIGQGGRIGVVLPRSASLSAPGMAKWRTTILEGGGFSDVCVIANTAGWVFPSVDGRYSIVFLTLLRQQPALNALYLDGPYGSHARYSAGRAERARGIPVREFRGWSSDASFPLLPSKQSVDVYRKLAKHPRLGAHPVLKFRPVREVDAANDRHRFIFAEAQPEGSWPVYGGSSFNLWTPDTGERYAWADADTISRYFFEKRKSQANVKTSAFHGMTTEELNDPATLPCRHPRIAFRDVARATDTRTFIAALIPANVVPQHKAPYLLRRGNSLTDEAFLLGVLSSRPLDWWARRHVETTLSFTVYNAFPVPNVTAGHPGFDLVVRTAGRLAAVDDRFAEWASEVRAPVGSVDEATRFESITLIDAAVAHLYGLTADELRHVYETFHTGWKAEEREPYSEAVLEHLASFTWDPAPLGQDD